MQNYYKILGVGKDSGFEEIRKAYLRKAKKYHPDVYKSPEAKFIFQQINEAYHILIDLDKRRYYDLKAKYDITQYRKYGVNYRERQKQHKETYSYYSSYTKKSEEAKSENKIIYKIKRHSDTFFFITMLLIGILTLIYGTYDLFFREWDGLKSLTGFLFGLSFTSLLIYGWYLRSRADKESINTGFFN